MIKVEYIGCFWDQTLRLSEKNVSNLQFQTFLGEKRISSINWLYSSKEEPIPLHTLSNNFVGISINPAALLVSGLSKILETTSSETFENSKPVNLLHCISNVWLGS